MAEASLYINIFSLLLSIYMLTFAYKHNNLICLIYIIVFQFLVIGQGIHISLSLIENNVVTYLYNVITIPGHLTASGMLLIICLFIIFMTKINKSDSIKYLYQSNSTNINVYFNEQIIWYYVVHCILLLLCAFFLIYLSGGISNWFTSGRILESGITFFIIGVEFSTYPLIFKNAYYKKPFMIDKILFIISFILIMSFSRILACFRIFIYLCVKYYFGSNRLLKSYNSSLIKMLFLLFIVMCVYGTYRHILSSLHSIEIIEIIDYMRDNPELTLFSLDLIYRISVEGMSGFSGVISETLKNSEICMDFGVSIINAFVKLIPSLFRDYLYEFSEFLTSFYWYKSSIVPSGLECFFVHFSFFMLIFYPISFCFYAYYLHHKINSVKSIPCKILFIVIAIVGLHIIRGSTQSILFYTLSETFVLTISYLWFRLFYSIKSNESNGAERFIR